MRLALALCLSLTGCGRTVTAPPPCAIVWVETAVVVRNAAGDSVGVVTVRNWRCAT